MEPARADQADGDRRPRRGHRRGEDQCLVQAVVAWGEARYDLTIATTMGLTTLSLMHVVAALEAREPTGTVFARYTIENSRFLQMIGAAVLLAFLVTALGPLQRIFGTTSLTSRQWGICLLGPIALLALLELGKLIDRPTSRSRGPRAAAAA
jgi:Ca2+-transporting ATPase